MAQIFSSTAACVAPAPATRMRFNRALAPAARLTSREARERLGNQPVSAAFASPSLAAARTRTFSTRRPSTTARYRRWRRVRRAA
jgi:hypothetical protein